MSEKVIALVLGLLMIVSATAACANTNPAGPGNSSGDASNESQNNPHETGKYQAELDALAGKTYDGATIRFAMSEFDNGKWIHDLFFDEDEEKTRVSSAVIKRNSAVEETYKVNLSYIPVNGYDEQAVMRNSIYGGNDDFEVVMPHANVCATMAQLELFRDWNDLRYVNLDGEYWDQDAKNSLSINHKLYIMTGDISYLSIGLSDVMVFNKTLCDALKIAYPYDDVRSGNWTFEKFEALAKKGSGDLNGDKVLTADEDRFGYVTQMYVGPVQAFYSAGQRVLSKDGSDMPYFNFYNDTTLKLFEDYFGLIDSDIAYVQKTGNSWTGEFIDMFMSGRVLFLDINLYDIASLREMDDEFGILPWPKYGETGEYCSNVDAGLHMMAVPITNKILDETSVVLEAMCILGSRDVIPEYFEMTAKSRDTRDDDSIEMLDYIKKSRVFDVGYYNCYYSDMFHVPFLSFITKTDRGFAAWYDSNVVKEQQGLNDLIDHYR